MSRKLAIKGHASRGEEIVEILKMLGAQNTNILYGCSRYLAYYIDDDGNIQTISSYNDDEFIVFSLQEFLYLYPYKINDLLDLKHSYVSCVITGMRWNEKSECIEYHAEFADNDYGWHTVNSFRTPNEMITPMKKTLAELLNHIKNTPKEELEREFNELEEWTNVGPTVEEFMDFCDKVNKNPVYPTDFDECKAVMQLQDFMIQARCGYEWRIISYFQQLLMCRDAYWKIAGEQMGLDKPWEPDWNESKPKYTIVVIENKLVKHYALTQNYILAFPTEEMRDVFYENFKDSIESCKTLL